MRIFMWNCYYFVKWEKFSLIKNEKSEKKITIHKIVCWNAKVMVQYEQEVLKKER